MTVHPWFCVFPESAILGQVRQHPEWLITSPKREMVGAVNPALPAVRAYEISLMLEVARKYDVGWVHLDYIRFPCEPTEPFFSFDAESLRLFKEDTGIGMAAVKAMKIGLALWPTDYSMRPTRLGPAMEERGFESVFVVEHTHIPASRRTPYPAGGPLPSIYWESYEPFTFLAQVAAVTERLKIGTGICLVP